MTIRSRLRNDVFVRIAALAALALTAIYTLPLVPLEILARFDEALSGPLLLSLVLVALVLRNRAAARAERRFWTYLTAGYSSWLVAHVAGWFVSGPNLDLLNGLVWDSLMLVFYLSVVLAAETGAHSGSGRSGSSAERRFGRIGAVFFAFGLLCYFVVIPGTFDAGSYASWVPSYVLYAVLDFYLLLRFLALARVADSPRWRAIYLLMAASAGFWCLNDGLEGLNVAGTVFIGQGSPLALLWYPHYMTAIAAARLAGGPWSRERDAEDASRAASGYRAPRLPGSSLIVLAMAFPVTHLVLDTLGFVAPFTAFSRQVLVLWMLVVLGSLAWLQQRTERRSRRGLQLEVSRIREDSVRSRHLRSVGRVSGGLAHDFRNVLASIHGSVELARVDGLRTQDVGGLCDAIDAAVEQGTGLTQQLLAFARIQVLEPVAVDVKRLVEESRGVMNGILEGRVRLHIYAASIDAVVKIDPGQMQQVLLNLAANARDAMPDGGTLTLRVAERKLDARAARRLPGLVEGRYVLLEAVDTGCGMDRATRARIFEPFFTTKGDSGGTGLGLASVYGIVRQSGGGIVVDSAPGSGSRFRIYLPATGDRPRRARESPAPTALPGVVEP